MFEAGEVQYMVATDAIGMGLNLDLDRVVFASVHKFDGRDVRPLTNDELAQVAGRAGRYIRDGKFGTLRPLPGLEPRTVAAIENHRFTPVRRVQWAQRRPRVRQHRRAARVSTSTTASGQSAPRRTGGRLRCAVPTRARSRREGRRNDALEGGAAVGRVPDPRLSQASARHARAAPRRGLRAARRAHGAHRHRLDGETNPSPRRHDGRHRDAHEPDRVHPDVDVHLQPRAVGPRRNPLAGRNA